MHVCMYACVSVCVRVCVLLAKKKAAIRETSKGTTDDKGEKVGGAGEKGRRRRGRGRSVYQSN